jgi:Spy/CpxP family protein refolding chaperone
LFPVVGYCADSRSILPVPATIDFYSGEFTMKATKRYLTSLILCLLFLGGSVGAEPQKAASSAKQEMKPHKMQKMHGRMKHHMKSYADMVIKQTEALGLSDEQLGKIVRIQMAEKTSRKELTAKLHKSMKKALDELRNPAVDEDAIRKTGAEHAADFDALIEAALQAREKIDAVLTPEQRAKLKATKPAMSDNEAANTTGGGES